MRSKPMRLWACVFLCVLACALTGCDLDTLLPGGDKDADTMKRWHGYMPSVSSASSYCAFPVLCSQR